MCPFIELYARHLETKVSCKDDQIQFAAFDLQTENKHSRQNPSEELLLNASLKSVVNVSPTVSYHIKTFESAKFGRNSRIKLNEITWKRNGYEK
jgi:hypothetical protein